MGWRSAALSAVRRVGGLRLVETFYGRHRVTVLAYHRVTDPTAAGFAGFVGNVSALPLRFDEQMAWAAERMSPISLADLAASLKGEPLPDRPLLVTFDDGYRDNLIEALPILRRHGVPVALFLATDHIGTPDPFWWDLVAWWFENSSRDEADLPLLGPTTWGESGAIAGRWIEAAKRLRDDARLDAVAALGAVLEAPATEGAFAETLLDWDEVRWLAEAGVSIGAHTRSHPILTRVGEGRVDAEISGSVSRVVEETGRPVLGFAYPNGQPGDFDHVARRAVRDAGVPLAFTLEPGPARPGEVTSDPLAIRRVYVHHRDDLARFAAKVAGVARLVGRG